MLLPTDRQVTVTVQLLKTHTETDRQKVGIASRMQGDRRMQTDRETDGQKDILLEWPVKGTVPPVRCL